MAYGTFCALTLCFMTAVNFAKADNFAWGFEDLPETVERCRIRAENIAENLQRNGIANSIDSQYVTGVVLNGLGRGDADAVIICGDAKGEGHVTIVVHARDIRDALGFRDRLKSLWQAAILTR
jgi:hypothetical protein